VVGLISDINWVLDATRFIPWVNSSKLVVLKVLRLVNFLLNGTHQVSNFESNATDFYYIIFSDLVTRKLKLRLPNLFYYLPNLLLRLPFQDRVCVLVNKVLVVNPVRVFSIKASSNYLFSLFEDQSFFTIFKGLFLNNFVSGDFWIVTTDPMTSFESHGSLLDLCAFEVVEPVRLSGPSLNIN
jgi:hypothetical protein